jgi:hypothetical protein
MRFHKIRLQNYRGVEDSEVSFAPQGVTVIQGPNEVGKTSIAEAISLILDELDSSSKQKVRDVKPVNKDVGAEVELEFTTGPYHLRYAKRWNSRAMTTLEILAPTHENLTGRPAHERVRQILEETTDEALWRALRYEQGVAITQATLNESRSLAAALDAAISGTGVTANGIEADLLEAVLTERSKYLTLTGRPTVDRTNLASEVTGLDGEVHALKEQLDAVEAATEQLPARVQRAYEDILAGEHQPVSPGITVTITISGASSVSGLTAAADAILVSSSDGVLSAINAAGQVVSRRVLGKTRVVSALLPNGTLAATFCDGTLSFYAAGDVVNAVPVGDEYPSTLIPWRDDVVFYQGNSLKVFDRAGRNVWAIEFPKRLASVAVNDRFLICGAGALDVFERN